MDCLFTIFSGVIMAQRTLLLLVASAFLLTACGQKGPLYFPKDTYNAHNVPTLYNGSSHDPV